MSERWYAWKWGRLAWARRWDRKEISASLTEDDGVRWRKLFAWLWVRA